MADAEYNKKMEVLQQYIPFLNNMIAQLKDPKKKNREQQLAKMELLHSMITDKKKKLKLETLVKCEDVILKLYNKVKNTSSSPSVVQQQKSALTPASPSPPRDIPRAKPIVIPTEKVTNKSIGKDSSSKNYSKEVNVYSSAADSLKQTNRPQEKNKKPSNVFDRLGHKTPDMSKPPITFEDLKELEIDNGAIEATAKSSNKKFPTNAEELTLNELNNLRNKLKKELYDDEKTINTTVRNALVLTKKPTSKPFLPDTIKVKSIDSTNDSDTDSKKGSNKTKPTTPEKVEKIEKVLKEPASIFGNLLTTIDNQLIEGVDKKQKEKKDERRNSTASNSSQSRSEKKIDEGKSKNEKLESTSSATVKTEMLDKNVKSSEIVLKDKMNDRPSLKDDLIKVKTEKPKHSSEKIECSSNKDKCPDKPRHKDHPKNKHSSRDESKIKKPTHQNDGLPKDKESLKNEGKEPGSSKDKKTRIKLSKEEYNKLKEKERNSTLSKEEKRMLASIRNNSSQHKIKDKSRDKHSSSIEDKRPQIKHVSSDKQFENIKIKTEPNIFFTKESRDKVTTSDKSYLGLSSDLKEKKPSAEYKPVIFNRIADKYNRKIKPKPKDPRIKIVEDKKKENDAKNLIPSSPLSPPLHEKPTIPYIEEMKNPVSLYISPTYSLDGSLRKNNDISHQSQDGLLSPPQQYLLSPPPQQHMLTPSPQHHMLSPPPLQSQPIIPPDLNNFLSDPNSTSIINSVVNQLKVAQQQQQQLNRPPLLPSPSIATKGFSMNSSQLNYPINYQQHNEMHYNDPTIYPQQHPFTPFDPVDQQPHVQTDPLEHFYESGNISGSYCNKPVLQHDNYSGSDHLHGPSTNMQYDNNWWQESNDQRMNNEWSTRLPRDPRHINGPPMDYRREDTGRGWEQQKDGYGSRDPRDKRHTRYAKESRDARQKPGQFRNYQEYRQAKERELNRQKENRARDPRVSRFNNRFDSGRNSDNSNTFNETSRNDNAFTSPLDSLYYNDNNQKTGKGYGVQNFRIPKVKKEVDLTFDDGGVDEPSNNVNIENEPQLCDESEMWDDEINTNFVVTPSNVEEKINDDEETTAKKDDEAASTNDLPSAHTSVSETEESNKTKSEESSDKNILTQFFSGLVKGDKIDTNKTSALLSLITTLSDVSEDQLKMITKILKKKPDEDVSDDAESIQENNEKNSEIGDEDNNKESSTIDNKLASKEINKDKKFKNRRSSNIQKDDYINDATGDDNNIATIDDNFADEGDNNLIGDDDNNITNEKDPDDTTDNIDDEEIITSVSERIKRRNRKRTTGKQKSLPDTNQKTGRKARHRTELDFLHEDIQDMFIRDGVLTANGKRMCSVLKNNASSTITNTSTTAPTTKVRRTKQLSSEKFDAKATENSDKLKVMSNVRVVLSKINISNELNDDNSNKRYSLRSVRGNVNYAADNFDNNDNNKNDDDNQIKGGESNVDSDNDDNNSVEDEQIDKSQKELSLSPNKVKTTKKRGRSWASGILPKSNKRSRKTVSVEKKNDDNVNDSLDDGNDINIEMDDDDDNKSERVNDNNENVDDDDNNIDMSQDKDLLPVKNYHDKDYCCISVKKKFPCKLCNFNGVFITNHYKNEHPKSEILCSRLISEKAEYVINESNYNNYYKDYKAELVGALYRDKYQCIFCNTIIKTSPLIFYDHITGHTGEYRHQCNICSFSCSTVKRIHAHYSKHNSIKHKSKHYRREKIIFGYICVECNYVQIKRESIVKHYEIYHQKRNDDDDVMITNDNYDNKIIQINFSLINGTKKNRKRKYTSIEIDDNLESVDDNLETIEMKKPKIDISLLNNDEQHIENTEINIDSSEHLLQKIETKTEVDCVKKEKEIDMDVFTCKTDIVEENKKIEEERLKRMEELNNVVKNNRLSLNFVDELSNRLMNHCKKEENDDINIIDDNQNNDKDLSTNNNTETENMLISPVKIKTEPIDNDIKPVIDKTITVNDESSLKSTNRQKPNTRIDGTIEKLRGLLDVNNIKTEVTDNNDDDNQNNDNFNSKQLPPLLPRPDQNKLADNVINILTTTFLNIYRDVDKFIYICRIPSCTFTTSERDLFKLHCQDTHKWINLKQKYLKCTLCNINVHLNDNNDSLLVLYFNHLLNEHPKLFDSNKPLLRMRRLSGDQLSTISNNDNNEPNTADSKSNQIKENTISSTITGNNTEAQQTFDNLIIPPTISPKTIADSSSITDVTINESPIITDENNDDNPFSFKIAGVVSLAKDDSSKSTTLVDNSHLTTLSPPPNDNQNTGSNIVLKEIKMTPTEQKIVYKSELAMKKFLSSTGDLFKCPEFNCQSSFNHKGSYDSHLNTHNFQKDELLPCVYCNVKTPKDHSSLHIIIQHSDCLYSCSHCLYRAIFKEYVKAHISMKHSHSVSAHVILLSKSYPSPVPIKSLKYFNVDEVCLPFICGETDCNQKFLFEHDFELHLTDKHHGILHCGHNSCYYKCVIPNNMVLHWRIHNFFTYNCLICKFGSVTNYTMLEHYSSVHSGRSPQVISRLTSKIKNPSIIESSSPLSYAESLKHIKCLSKEILDSTSFNVNLKIGNSSPVKTSTAITTTTTKGNLTFVAHIKKVNIEPLTNASKVQGVATMVATTSTTMTTTAATAITTATSTITTTVPSTTMAHTIPTTLSTITSATTTISKEPIILNSTVLPAPFKLNNNFSVIPLTHEESNARDEPLNDNQQLKSVNQDNNSLNLDDNVNNDNNSCDNINMSTPSTPTTDENDLQISSCMKNLGLIGSQLYRCAFCNESFDNSKEFKLHYDNSKLCRDNNTGKPFKCAHCERGFKVSYRLLEHIQYHGQLRYSCSLCVSKFPAPLPLRSHMKNQHSVTNTILTPIIPNKNNADCDEFILKPKQLVEATDVKSEQQSIENNLIKKNSKLSFLPSEIDELPKRHIFEFELQCSLCSYKTKVRTNLLRHFHFHELETNVPGIAPVNPVPCLNKKEKMFDKMTNLAISSITGVGENKSNLSNKAIKDEKEIPGYIPSNRRYVCCAPGCNYLCPEEGNLRHHLLALHESEDSFQCAHCKVLLATDIDSFIKHLKLHDLHLYKCYHCNFVHNLRHKVERHLNDKHSNLIQNVITVRAMDAEIYDINNDHQQQQQTNHDEKMGTSDDQQTSSPANSGIKSTKPWHCGMCKCRYTNQDDILTHISNKHNIDTQYKCTLCTYKSDDIDIFDEHFKDKHPDNIIDIIHVYRKVEFTQKNDNKQQFDTTPLWQRDRPRVRHIRGILFDEATISKSCTNSNVKKGIRTSIEGASTSTGGNDNIDLAIEAVVKGTAETMKTEIKHEIKTENHSSNNQATESIIIIDDDEEEEENTGNNRNDDEINVDSNNTKNKTINNILLSDDDDVHKRKRMPELPSLSRNNKNNDDDDDDIDDNLIIDIDPVDENRVLNENKLQKLYSVFCAPTGKLFKCPKCIYTCKRVTFFTEHLLREFTYLRYKCSECDIKIMNYNLMKKHCELEHKNEMNKIIEIPVNKSLEYWIQLLIKFQCERILAVSTVSNGSEFPIPLNQTQCLYCNRWFKNKIELKDHELFHWSKLNFGCGYCNTNNLTFDEINKHTFNRHYEFELNLIVNGPKMNEIYKVLKKSNYENDTHSNTREPTISTTTDKNIEEEKNNEINYDCIYCKASCKTIELIRLHCNNVHKQQPFNYKKRIQKTFIMLYCCNYCHTQGTVDYLKKHHKKVHDGSTFNIYQFICLECSNTFRTHKDLSLHFKRIHPTKKLFYNCIENMKVTSIDTYLNEKKIFKCIKCPFRSSSKAGMSTHIRKHARIFTCLICDLMFPYNSEATQHHRKEHNHCAENIEKNVERENEWRGILHKIYANTKSASLINDNTNSQPSTSTDFDESTNDDNDDLMIVDNQIMTARKSTAKLHRELEEYSYYGQKSADYDLKKIMTNIEVNENANNTTTGSIQLSRVALPKLQLPSFDGDYKHWRPYCDAFSSLVTSDSDLTPVMKMYYLKGSLRGEAARLINNLKLPEKTLRSLGIN